MRSWLAVVALNVLMLLPLSMSQGVEPWLALGLCGDVLVLVTLMGWWRRPRLAAFVYGALLVYEFDRLIGAWLMGQDPLLFDQALLLRHLLVLVMDLHGALGLLMLGGAGLVIVGLLAVGAWLFRVAAEAPGLKRLAWLVPVAFGLAFVGRWPARWVVPDLVVDVWTSVEVVQRLGASVGTVHPELKELPLARKPDVELHIIESYGRMMNAPALSEAWHQRLAESDDALGDDWTVVSAWMTAPVAGGRSWIADASLLLGVKLEHQSEYQAIAGTFHDKNHMPQWFEDRGYQSVVMRPKDRARPGIELRDDFGWNHTVFHAELNYRGPLYGWGGVPDQYSLGWLREELWPTLEGPRFLFSHMVGSHAPWEEIPPLVQDWRTLDDGSGETTEDKEVDLAREASKFARKKKTRAGYVGKLKRRGEDYQTAVHYDLEVLTRDLQRPRDEDAVVVWLGDHQPPLFSLQKNFDVPVHVLTTDPVFVEGLKEAGFTEGFVPDGKPVGGLWELYPMLVRSISQ